MQDRTRRYYTDLVASSELSRRSIDKFSKKDHAYGNCIRRHTTRHRCNAGNAIRSITQQTTDSQIATRISPRSIPFLYSIPSIERQIDHLFSCLSRLSLSKNICIMFSEDWRQASNDSIMLRSFAFEARSLANFAFISS